VKEHRISTIEQTTTEKELFIIIIKIIKNEQKKAKLFMK